jgi:SAM-dependent methyltransferase
MLLYACTIFLSAFLLFQVQPLIAKMILPWFGGSAAVWTACVLFFQLLLLLGYLYSHWTIRYLRPKAQTILHIALLAASLLMLPAIPNPAWKPMGAEDPTLRILGLLAATIGLPYFLLSTTGPLIQAWFVRERLKAGATAYRLYALSNLGSMLALLSYPVLVEPYFVTQNQGYGWSAGYVAFVVFCGITAWRGLTMARQQVVESNLPDAAAPDSVAPDAWLMLAWVGLAACASTLLLAVTNHLSQNVAAIPFLWVLPLALYLLSFILCFDGDGWYRRYWFLGLFAVSAGSMVYALFTDSENMPLKLALPLFAIGLFVSCMVCHGELARLKPDPRHLTLFYLMVSIGGAIGGIFVGLIAPHVFSGYYELPIAVVASAALVLMVLRRDLLLNAQWSFVWLASAVCVLGLTGYVGYELKKSIGGYRVSVRNFYGGLKVHDSGTGQSAVRSLTHGTINHGEQYLDPARRRMPTTYYGPHSGVALAIRAEDPDGPVHVGVIGLGTGTLATFGRPGDRVRYYEINPLVIGLARTEFTFLNDCQAKLEVVLGDARLSLEREPEQNFDVLAVDAFSSDSIPVHLLTVEAFRLYFHHLKPTGVLAVHVSNKYLDLKPIVELASEALRKQTRVIDTDDEDDIGEFGSTWVLVADGQFFQRPEIKDAGSTLLARNELRLWTDDYSNLFRILK